MHDEIGIRMKKFYEEVPKTRLMRRCPVCIRIDGKSHHNFTKGFKRPFDEVYIKSMQETAKYLCENIQGVVISYQQSDEISLILVDYKKLDSAAWFDYEIQKMCSVAASMATMAFNKILKNTIDVIVLGVTHYGEDYDYEMASKMLNLPTEVIKSDRFWDVINVYQKAIDKGAMFDARAFNIPKEEVANYIYWRQNDATRNSIQMVGRAYFSDEELHKKSNSEIQDMLMMQKGVNWNNLPTHQKRGSCCIKEKFFLPDRNGSQIDNESGKGTWRSRWVIHKEIPIFKGKDRKYIDDLIYIGE